MGLTPLEGLIMGTRSGDVDPALHAYLARTAAMSLDEIDALLNRDSGLKGLCGSNDLREIHRAADGGDEAARLALEMYCYRIRKYIGAYTAVLGRVDALAFTAGVGENDARVRARCCAGLEHLGIELDEQRNADPEGDPASVGASSSRVRVLVVGTNEELQIAHEVARCLAGNAA
jgi:acetate kinase